MSSAVSGPDEGIEDVGEGDGSAFLRRITAEMRRRPKKLPFASHIATDYRQPMREPFPLASMSVPVLDLFGAEDYPAVLGKAPARLAAMRMAGDPRSAQRIIPGTGHFFRGSEDAIVEAVTEWLTALGGDR